LRPRCTKLEDKAPEVFTQPQSRLKIIEAHYGVEGINNPDVTHYLLERLHGNSYAELVGADLFHGFDPLSGNPNKKLTLRYSFDGKEAGIVRPEHEWLILPEDMFLRKLLDACRQEQRVNDNQARADLSRAQEAYRQCMEEKRESAILSLEHRDRLAQYAEEKQELQKQVDEARTILSPLQFGLIYLARDLRKMLNANPTPVPLDHAGSSEENTAQMIQHKEWSDRIFYHYRDEFSARLQKIQGVIGMENSSLAMYLARFVGNGYMQANDIDSLIKTLWDLAYKFGEIYKT